VLFLAFVFYIFYLDTQKGGFFGGMLIKSSIEMYLNLPNRLHWFEMKKDPKVLTL